MKLKNKYIDEILFINNVVHFSCKDNRTLKLVSDIFSNAQIDQVSKAVSSIYCSVTIDNFHLAIDSLLKEKIINEEEKTCIYKNYLVSNDLSFSNFLRFAEKNLEIILDKYKGNDGLLFNAYFILGDAYSNERKFSKAAYFYLEALEVLLSLKYRKHDQEAKIHSNLSFIFNQLGKERAIQYKREKELSEVFNSLESVRYRI